MTIGLTRQLSRTKPHREALLKNLASQLLQHGSIVSTTPKLKEAKRYVERIINIAKQAQADPQRHMGELQRRLFLSGDNSKLLKKLVHEIAPACAGRNGGYTRLLRLEPRLGDRAPSAVLELVDSSVVNAAGNICRGNVKLWLAVKAFMHALENGERPTELTIKHIYKLSKTRDLDTLLRDVGVIRGAILKNGGVETTPEDTEHFIEAVRQAIVSFDPKKRTPHDPSKKGYVVVGERPQRQ